MNPKKVVPVLVVALAFLLFLVVATDAQSYLSDIGANLGTEHDVAPDSTITVHLHEDIELNVPVGSNYTDDEIAEAVGKSGFPWTGSIVLQVEKADYYASASDSMLDLIEPPEDGKGLLVLTIKLFNRDATGIIKTREGQSWFNITSIFNNNSIAYFDGMPTNANKSTDYYFFDLPQGGSAEFHVALNINEAQSDSRIALGSSGALVLDWEDDKR